MKKFVGIALPAVIAGLLAVSPQAAADDGYYAGTGRYLSRLAFTPYQVQQ